VSVLLEAAFPRTLDEIVRRFGEGAHRGARLEAWLFEDEAARRAAEARLALAGVTATLRSAYKPLVHAFLEEIDARDAARVEIVFPVHPAADPGRFRLEAYPLAALLEPAEVAFVPGGANLVYEATVERRDGSCDRHEIFAPNRVAPNPVSGEDLAPTGWLKLEPADGGGTTDEPLETEIERLFRAAVGAVAAHRFPDEPPFFEQLAITVSIPGIERPLPFGLEVMSTREALHEDLYFTLLELFRHRAGRPPGDRSLQPGQIVPDIREGDGDARIRIALESYDGSAEPGPSEDAVEDAERAPSLQAIRAALEALPGETLKGGRSAGGRPVRGVLRRGRRPAILVTAGQHANEPSGPVGALRASRRLLQDLEASLAVIPVENPDGYALHRRLCEHSPRHMHHAARYTALGCDVDAGPPDRLPELKVRQEAIVRSGARLHVNLHGYPAHEWTRPFTGYIPRGFASWTLPKGFLLLLRHHPGHAEEGRRLVEAVATALRAVPGLPAFNERQIAVCRAHGGEVPGELIAGIPCVIDEDARHPVPLTLITEFPDETIEGEAFRFAHTVQMAAVVAAEAAYAAIAGAEA